MTLDFCYGVQLDCIVCVNVVQIMEEPAIYNAIVLCNLFQYYDQMSKKGPVECVSLAEMIFFRYSNSGNISESNK